MKFFKTLLWYSIVLHFENPLFLTFESSLFLLLRIHTLLCGKRYGSPSVKSPRFLLWKIHDTFFQEYTIYYCENSKWSTMINQYSVLSLSSARSWEDDLLFHSKICDTFLQESYILSLLLNSVPFEASIRYLIRNSFLLGYSIFPLSILNSWESTILPRSPL